MTSQLQVQKHTWFRTHYFWYYSISTLSCIFEKRLFVGSYIFIIELSCTNVMLENDMLSGSEDAFMLFWIKWNTFTYLR